MPNIYNLLLVLIGCTIIHFVCYWIGQPDRWWYGALLLSALWGMATSALGYSILNGR